MIAKKVAGNLCSAFIRFPPRQDLKRRRVRAVSKSIETLPTALTLAPLRRCGYAEEFGGILCLPRHNSATTRQPRCHKWQSLETFLMSRFLRSACDANQ